MKQRRQSLAMRSLSRVPPSSSEAEALHSFYLQYGQEDTGREADVIGSERGDQRVWMGDTILEKTLLMFPQERK